MELVINQTFPSSYQQIFGFRNDSTFDFYFLATSGGGTEFRARNSAGTYYDSNPSIAAYSGKYVHIIFSIGANGSQVYYNGTLVYSAGWSGALGSSSPFNIGRNASGMWFANGTMPIAKLYTKQLSSTEVTQNYNQYKTRFNLS